MTEGAGTDGTAQRNDDNANAQRPEWERRLSVSSAEQTQELAAALAVDLGPGDLLLLDGELGAGKTTFTQGLGRGLGVREGIISPTFVLARRHPHEPSARRPDGPGLVHVDAYRLTDAAQVEDIDLEETLAAWVTVVEWGRGKVEALSDSRLEIRIDRAVGADRGLAEVLADLEREADEGQAPEETRTLTVRGFGPRWADTIPAALA